MIKKVTLKNTVIGEGLPKICVPIVGHTEEEIRLQAEEIAAEAPDLAEWRADYYEDLSDPEKMKKTAGMLSEILKDIPVLFTFRSSLEGGEREISASEYEKLNILAARQPGIAMVDVEGRRGDLDSSSLVSAIHAEGKPVVASSHFFHDTPDSGMLERIFRELEDTGADLLKLAVMPRSEKDVLRLLEVTEEQKRRTDRPVITMSMGRLGVVSRISGSLTGSAVTFGTVGSASAPGQLPVDILKEILNRI